MYKEPISFIYRYRGMSGRIRKAGRRWPKPYDIRKSPWLRIEDRKDYYFRAIPFSHWKHLSKN